MSDNTTVRDNIILFPKQKKEAPSTKLSDKEMKIAREAQIRMFSHQLKDVAMDDLFDLLNKNGIDVTNINFQKDFAFISDAVKSLIQREFKLKHPIQAIVDHSVQVDLSTGVPTTKVVFKNILVRKDKDVKGNDIP